MLLTQKGARGSGMTYLGDQKQDGALCDLTGLHISWRCVCVFIRVPLGMCVLMKVLWRDAVTFFSWGWRHHVCHSHRVLFCMWRNRSHSRDTFQVGLYFKVLGSASPKMQTVTSSTKSLASRIRSPGLYSLSQL